MISAFKSKQKNLETFLERKTQPAVANLKPLMLWLEITTRCNLKCIKCGHSFAPPSNSAPDSRDLPFAMVESLDLFFAAAVRVHTFGYGEMFLYSKLRILIERLKRYDCLVDGVTNGVLIGNDESDWLMDHRFDELTFSIDGLRPETMSRLRGVNVERLFQILTYLRDGKRSRGTDRPRIIVNFVAESCNIRELPGLAQTLAELGVHFLGVNPLYKPGLRWKGTTYDELYRVSSLRNIPRIDVEDALEQSRAIAQRSGYGFASYLDLDSEYDAPEGLIQIDPSLVVEAAQHETPSLPPHYCAYPWLSLYVHANSNVRFCCYMEGSLGQARDGIALAAIWEGKLANELRAAVAQGDVHEKCRGCVQRGYYKHSQLDAQGIEQAVTNAVAHPAVSQGS